MERMRFSDAPFFYISERPLMIGSAFGRIINQSINHFLMSEEPHKERRRMDHLLVLLHQLYVFLSQEGRASTADFCKQSASPLGGPARNPTRSGPMHEVLRLRAVGGRGSSGTSAPSAEHGRSLNAPASKSCKIVLLNEFRPEADERWCAAGASNDRELSWPSVGRFMSFHTSSIPSLVFFFLLL